MNFSLSRRATAEFIGTALLVAAVIGSGIMAERLSGGNMALELLANTIATGAALVALIFMFGEISGAHFNPVVTLMLAMGNAYSWRETPHYVIAQILGGIAGAVIANGMFGLRLVTVSLHARHGSGQLCSEFVATFGLLAVIWGCSRPRRPVWASRLAILAQDPDGPHRSIESTCPSCVPFAVAAYITSAYWFTASTSFANPAVTIARCLSDTFAGIRPADVPGFMAAQFAGGLGVTLLFRWFFKAQRLAVRAESASHRSSI